MRSRAWRWGQYLRRATVPLRPLPDFVIIGVQGCGTTSLYRWLCGHPKVARASTKEVRYFDRHYELGERWYRAQFPLSIRRRVTGEATPNLFFHPLVPARVAQDLPRSTPLVVLLRDPTDRAISRYYHLKRVGIETETLERAIALEPERLAATRPLIMDGGVSRDYQVFSYVASGQYAELLRRWQEHCGPDRVVVLESEELFRSPDSRQQLLSTLGLDPYDRPFPAVNSVREFREGQGDPDNASAVRMRLEEHFAPHNEELFSLLGRRLWGK